MKTSEDMVIAMLDKIKNIIFEQNNVTQLPGTKRFQKGQMVTHNGQDYIVHEINTFRNKLILRPPGALPEKDVIKDPTGYANFKSVPPHEVKMKTD